MQFRFKISGILDYMIPIAVLLIVVLMLESHNNYIYEERQDQLEDIKLEKLLKIHANESDKTQLNQMIIINNENTIISNQHIIIDYLKTLVPEKSMNLSKLNE